MELFGEVGDDDDGDFVFLLDLGVFFSFVDGDAATLAGVSVFPVLACGAAAAFFDAAALSVVARGGDAAAADMRGVGCSGIVCFPFVSENALYQRHGHGAG